MKLLKNDKFVNIAINVILVIVAICCIYPIWYVVIASFSEPSAVTNGEVFFWPKQFTLDGYKELFKYPQLLTGFRNSILYLFGGTFISFLVTFPAAYALSRERLVGRKFLNFIFVISMYFNGGMIATYMLHSTLGWVNTVWVMVIPTAVSVYNLIVSRTAFASIPEALYEAVRIDGATDFRFFLQFALPLSKATIAVLFLFSALGWWNQYMRFVIYISDPELQSIQVVVQHVIHELQNTAGQELAGATPQAIEEGRRLLSLMNYSVVVAVALPFIIIYPFVQKYFNKGVMIGAVKG